MVIHFLNKNTRNLSYITIYTKIHIFIQNLYNTIYTKICKNIVFRKILFGDSKKENEIVWILAKNFRNKNKTLHFLRFMTKAIAVSVIKNWRMALIKLSNRIIVVKNELFGHSIEAAGRCPRRMDLIVSLFKKL